jgi:catechol 2,3-dioxygenase-like lactoylglutathione lyase family enzyme
MKLGAFSVSLAVKDLQKSIDFYTQLGFEVGGGDIEHGWCILRSDTTTIGLFQGMFEHNILTFNPGWAQDATALDAFEDVRSIQERIEASGLAIEILERADPDGEGPAHLILHDPDNNVIMFDQHVPKKK